MCRLDLLLRKILSASRATHIMMMFEYFFFQSGKICSQPLCFLTATSSQALVLLDSLLLIFDAPAVLVEL
ncbi:hypothetical protein D3C75_1147170 [compost metagenome]